MRCPRGWVLTPAFVDAAFADPNTATDENSSRPRPGMEAWRVLEEKGMHLSFESHPYPANNKSQIGLKPPKGRRGEGAI